MTDADGDPPDGGDLDTGVQMPAFAALVDEIRAALDGALTREARLPFLSSSNGGDAPRLSVTRWSGRGLRLVRIGALSGAPGAFAISLVAFPQPDVALPIFSFQYLVSRERLQMVAIDLLDTEPTDDSWSRDQLRRARRVLELPIGASSANELPPWARRALSPSAIVVVAPAKLPSAGQVRRAVVGIFEAYLAVPSPRPSKGLTAASIARRTEARESLRASDDRGGSGARVPAAGLRIAGRQAGERCALSGAKPGLSRRAIACLRRLPTSLGYAGRSIIVFGRSPRGDIQRRERARSSSVGLCDGRPRSSASASSTPSA